MGLSALNAGGIAGSDAGRSGQGSANPSSSRFLANYTDFAILFADSVTGQLHIAPSAEALAVQAGSFAYGTFVPFEHF
jgi:hypothetical protein